MRAFIILILSLTALLNVGLGAAVVQRTPRRLYAWLFAVTLLAIALWSVGDILLLTGNSSAVVHVGAELFYIAPLVVPISIMLFSYAFLESNKLDWLSLACAGLIIVLWTILLIANIGIIVDYIDMTGVLNMPVVSLPGFVFYALHFSVFFLITYAILFRKMKKARGVDRTQISYTFYGVIISSILAMVTNLSLPVMGDSTYIWLGPVFTLIFGLMVTISIIKHRLFDLHFFALRATAYLATMLTLSVLYVAPTIYILGVVVMDYPFTWPKYIVAVVVGTIAAVNYEKIRFRFDRLTAKYFFRDDYDSAALIGELNKVLASTTDLNKLLQDSAETIVKNIKADYCVFVLNETANADKRLVGNNVSRLSDRELLKSRHYNSKTPGDVLVTDFMDDEQPDLKAALVRSNVAVLIRLKSNTGSNADGLGRMFLGIKKSGNAYNVKDIRTLEAIADVLTIAIQNALHFEEIQTFNLTLQQRIEERTRQLRRTNAKLVALDETKDDFISMASHQLRTPLTSVKGYLSMVIEGDAGKITGMQKKMLNQAYLSSQHMVYLIADLLNVSRLKNGKFVIEPAPVNLAAMIQEEIGQLRETAKARSLELLYDKPKEFPSLMLDETKTRQVVMNFIDNAIHYTPAGGHIRVELADKPHTVELRVVDDGIGVPKSEQPHLFTKFYRAVNARRERPDGTGLGLFMAKKVVVAQGGAILFDSKENKGSQFGFTLPKDRLAVASIDKSTL